MQLAFGIELCFLFNVPQVKGILSLKSYTLGFLSLCYIVDCACVIEFGESIEPKSEMEHHIYYAVANTNYPYQNIFVQYSTLDYAIHYTR